MVGVAGLVASLLSDKNKESLWALVESGVWGWIQIAMPFAIYFLFVPLANMTNRLRREIPSKKHLNLMREALLTNATEI
jgi:hypothetical protein